MRSYGFLHKKCSSGQVAQQAYPKTSLQENLKKYMANAKNAVISSSQTTFRLKKVIDVTRELTEPFVKKLLIENWLYKNKWTRMLRVGELSEKGVDIKVRHAQYGRDYLIEAKGDPPKGSKNPHSIRENYFITALGQILTRMKYKSNYCYGVAFPSSYKKKAVKRIPWRVSKKLNLHVFIIYSTKKVERLTWKELKKHQS